MTRDETKRKKESRVPELRFPGFEGEWEEKPLTDLAGLQTGTTPSKKRPEFWNGPYLWATLKDFQGRKIEKTCETLTKEGFDQVPQFPPETVLLSTGATLGALAILKKSGSCNQQLTGLIPTEKTSADFLYYMLSSQKQRLSQAKNSGIVDVLSIPALKKLRFPIPTLPEQQKIAEFFETLDAYLESTREKLLALKDYKKGMLQKMFPKEGKKEPEIRFKGFEGEWEEERLSSICSFSVGTRLVKTASENGKYPFFTCSRQPEKCNIAPFDQEAILYASAGVNVGLVFYINGRFDASNHTYIFSNKTSEIKLKYLYYWFIKNRQEILQKLANSGAKMTGVSLRAFDSLRANVPSPPEQQKIAEFFTSLDERISMLEKKLKVLKLFKKGLLQKMFPKDDTKL